MFPRLTLLAVPLLFLCAATRGADPAPAGRAFKVTVVADLTMTVGGRDEQVTATGAYRYSWTPDGTARVLRLADMNVKATAGGRELMDVRLSRAGLSGTQDGQALDMTFADAPDQLKAMLRDSFDAPLYRLERDPTGKETKRTAVAGPGAKGIADEAMLANTTLFHPPYHANKDEWTADVAVSVGKGVVVGPLTYTKVPGGKGGQAVKVSGTLKADGVKSDRDEIIKDGVYAVTGRQTYDPDAKEWVAGQLDVALTYRMFKGDNEVGKAKGKLVATFEMLPAKK